MALVSERGTIRSNTIYIRNLCGVTAALGVFALFNIGNKIIGILLLSCAGLLLLYLIPRRAEIFRSHHHNAAISAIKQHRYDVAERHFLACLKHAEKLGTQDNRLALALLNLGGTYMLLERNDKAVPLLERALEIYQNTTGPAPDRQEDVLARLRQCKKF